MFGRTRARLTARRHDQAHGARGFRKNARERIAAIITVPVFLAHALAGDRVARVRVLPDAVARAAAVSAVRAGLAARLALVARETWLTGTGA